VQKIDSRMEMRAEHFEQLLRWFEKEREAFKLKGAHGEILSEPAFLGLVWDAVIARNGHEILRDPELLEGILEAASPEQFRKLKQIFD
jgi:hypothetical protein